MGELHRIECPLAAVNNQKYARKTKPQEQTLQELTCIALENSSNNVCQPTWMK